MLYCVGTPRRLRGPNGNAWRTGFWLANRMLDTPVLASSSDGTTGQEYELRFSFCTKYD